MLAAALMATVLYMWSLVRLALADIIKIVVALHMWFLLDSIILQKTTGTQIFLVHKNYVVCLSLYLNYKSRFFKDCTLRSQ